MIKHDFINITVFEVALVYMLLNYEYKIKCRGQSPILRFAVTFLVFLGLSYTREKQQKKTVTQHGTVQPTGTIQPNSKSILYSRCRLTV